MNIKYYGLPNNPELLRRFIKAKTGTLVTKSRAERMFDIYTELQKTPLMVHSSPFQADFLLLAKAGLIFPMTATLSTSNFKDWAMIKMGLF